MASYLSPASAVTSDEKISPVIRPSGLSQGHDSGGPEINQVDPYLQVLQPGRYVLPGRCAARLTVPESKDLVSLLPGTETAGRKDELIERITVGMLDPALNTIWSGIDDTQQSRRR